MPVENDGGRLSITYSKTGDKLKVVRRHELDLPCRLIRRPAHDIRKRTARNHAAICAETRARHREEDGLRVEFRHLLKPAHTGARRGD